MQSRACTSYAEARVFFEAVASKNAASLSHYKCLYSGRADSKSDRAGRYFTFVSCEVMSVPFTSMPLNEKFQEPVLFAVYSLVAA